ncbi:MAG: PDDEXK nuclease domain-containing protein, partial [Ferruginibacter sp.]
DSFFVDLVLYNRLLKCYVLLDLKIGRLAHQDIGQMQMYVNYYDRKMKLSEENSMALFTAMSHSFLPMRSSALVIMQPLLQTVLIPKDY